MRATLAALFLFIVPAPCPSATAPDLSARIRIDASLDEYLPGEWVLDAGTVFAEAPDDSRWGSDNDIRRLAVTWDSRYLYIAVEVTTSASVLMVFVEHTAGGVSDLVFAGALRRNIVFSRITPNLVIEANRSAAEARAAVVSISEPPRYVGPDALQSRFFQPARGPGALEAAVPWDRILPESGQIRVLAVVTAGPGTGAGDAAPDPRERLPVLREAQVRLDNAVTLTVDRNYDGEPDIGVSPRDEAAFEFVQDTPRSRGAGFVIELGTSTVLPGTENRVNFRVRAVELDEPVQYYLTGEVYSIAGDRVRVLFRDRAQWFEPGVMPPEDVWDGRDDSGEFVDGGIYVLSVTGGYAPGATDYTARKPVSVVR